MVLGIEEQSLFLRALKEKDLPMVLDIEERVYGFPWSQQIFKDCLSMGYSSWALINEGELIAYTVLSIAVGEAHILNICIHPEKQGKGFGRFFLQKLFKIAKDKKAERIFLEVRPSNKAAIDLYKKLGFEKIGQRKAYYPTKDGREDALVYSFDLTSLID
ncbi:MAG: ribosomal-protein-alanine N-acetyltransferase [Piscirickettsiaceae bacterium]|nr:MAG: ribosomal-protein-alanine N-acetyltransferase [Piscirickettsiaceae bacterium]